MPAYLWEGIDVLQYVATRDDKAPYLAKWIWAHTFVEQPGLGTFAVDKWWRMYWDPKLRERWTLDEAVGVLIHEIMHSGCAHADRAETVGVTDAQHFAWNASADAEINESVLENFTLPKGVVRAADVGGTPGETAEEMFARLKQQQQQQQQQPSCGSGSGGAPIAGEQGPPDGSDGKLNGKSGGSNTQTGSSAQSVAPGLSPTQQEMARDDVARDIESGVAIGRVPQALKRWAKARRHPKGDWRRALRVACGNAIARTQGMADYTYKRRARRAAADPRLIMPGLVDPLPKVGIVADTSGSMGDEQLEAILAEAEGIIREVAGGYGVEWASVDATVHDRVRGATSIAQLEGKLTGGGGTDMGEGIAEMARAHVDVCAVLTDGLTPWPDSPPMGMTVVVAVIHHVGSGTRAVPSWARLVDIEIDG